FIESRVGDGTYVAQLPTAKKLSTKVSTGLSTGLSPALSTKWANLPQDLDSEVIHSGGLAQIKTNHLPQPPAGPPRAFRV
ncbi:PLP-dependent aminotransferase family protein, partial [Pseudomonas fragi]